MTLAPEPLTAASNPPVEALEANLGPGDVIRRSATLAADLPLGHKLARRPIAAGEKIVKYGAPIGTATEAIAIGTPVHVHNVKSDYTPTYHLMDADKPGAGA